MNRYDFIYNQINSIGHVIDIINYITVDMFYRKFDVIMRKEIRKLNKAIRERTKSVSSVEYKISTINKVSDNLDEFYYKFISGTYNPKHITISEIPKGNGESRVLGIPCIEDKLIQAIMTDCLKHIYEPIFLSSSYGYRVGRGCHTALKSINKIINSTNANYIVKADISKFFDNIDHQQLLEILQQNIQDKQFLQYITKFLKAGYLQDGIIQTREAGTPQGGVISPILGNVYLHYNLDTWFEHKVKDKCKDAEFVRYCDDFIGFFQNTVDADWFYHQVQHILGNCNLQLSSNKSYIKNIQPWKSSHFDFLGFNICRLDDYVSFKCSNSKLKKKLYKIRTLVTENTEFPASEMIAKMNSLLSGLYSYYSVNTNKDFIDCIYNTATITLHNWLIAYKKCTELEASLIMHYKPIVKPPEKLIQL